MEREEDEQSTENRALDTGPEAVEKCFTVHSIGWFTLDDGSHVSRGHVVMCYPIGG